VAGAGGSCCAAVAACLGRANVFACRSWRQGPRATPRLHAPGSNAPTHSSGWALHSFPGQTTSGTARRTRSAWPAAAKTAVSMAAQLRPVAAARCSCRCSQQCQARARYCHEPTRVWNKSLLWQGMMPRAPSHFPPAARAAPTGPPSPSFGGSGSWSGSSEGGEEESEDAWDGPGTGPGATIGARLVSCLAMMRSHEGPPPTAAAAAAAASPAGGGGEDGGGGPGSAGVRSPRGPGLVRGPRLPAGSSFQVGCRSDGRGRGPDSFGYGIATLLARHWEELRASTRALA
jgi:hypothetical protein